MKIRKKKFIIFALSILLCFSTETSFLADSIETYNVYYRSDVNGLLMGEIYTPRLTTMPDEITYYISNKTAFSAYTRYAREAFNNWNSDTYGINMTETTTYSTSVIDVKGYDPDSIDPEIFNSVSDYNDVCDCLGFTMVHWGGGAYSGNNDSSINSQDVESDYWLAEIYINYDLIPASVLNTTAGKNMLRHVFSHEIGHALGLGHNQSDERNLMYSGYNSNSPMFAGTNEKYQVSVLYSYR